MEAFSVKNLSFSYPKASENALDDISFEAARGDFIVLCGQSGSGKSTLLRLLKPQLSPSGNLKGEIFFGGVPLKEVTQRESAEKIGFVMQNPDTQIVTDKVYHELAFAMESLGYDRETIRLRTGEMAGFFGLSEAFEKDTATLSGGQKQLLNLASVLTLQPDALILDEPESQLDPLASESFLNMLKKLNRDFGITVIMSEHNLADVFDFASKIMVLDKGKIIAFAPPEKINGELKKTDGNHPMLSALPAPVRVYNGLSPNCPAPLNINEGRNFLYKNYKNDIRALPVILQKNEKSAEPLLNLKSVYFRYEKSSPDVLKDFNLNVNKGEIYALLGANGSGKSTAVKIISGILRPYHGKIKMPKALHTAYLPQNPKTLFIKDTVRESLCYNSEKEFSELIKDLRINNLLESHPFDLSGGELQKAALAKLLLNKPELLLLDEPTKGIDAFAKKELAEILRKLQESGVTILIVTHDTDFACLASDRCGLLFDGCVIAEKQTREFFGGNGFYTTEANKMSRGFFESAVTCEAIIELCKINGEKNDAENH